tara:strand:- start:10072 stop:10449 length:378 start_codon:yes stop_codon:yes gene_type:complete
MNSLIIDTAGKEIFLKIIFKGKEYSIQHNNCRENFDELVILVFDFLKENRVDLINIDNVFINQGPGKYTSIRSAISIVKALKISKKINIYGYYSSQIINNNYNILIKLLEEGRLTKDFIQPKYLN